MMKLSTMQAVVATVDEQWESPIADEILSRWEHDESRAKYWRASTNFVFFFKWLSHDYVLRFNRVDERALDAIAAELDYVNALAAKGIRIAQPIRSRSGQYVERIETTQGAFHAVVFGALPGKQFDLEELSVDQLKAWGKALGELHQAATTYNKLGRPSWEAYLEMVVEHVPRTEQGAWREMEELRQALHQLPVTEQTFGLIHYDFEPDNLIWEGAQPGIIDVDDCAWHWFAADIALALSELFDDHAENVDIEHDSLLRFMQGYSSVRAMEQVELTWLPLFIRFQNLVTFTRLYRALTPVDPAGELPWMDGLRRKLAAKMQFYRDGFPQ